MYRWSLCGRLALATFLALGPLSFAIAAAPALTLREAVSRALHFNPDLAAYQHILKAQDGRIEQAHKSPNPVFNASVENVLGRGAVRGVEPAEITLGLSQVIELGGLRSKRAAVAQFERDGLEAEGHIGRLDVMAETARRFVLLVSLQEQHQLTHLAVELAGRTSATVEKRVAAAKSPLAERDRAAVALERAKTADAHAEHELLAARYELAALWGSERPDFEVVSADLYDLPPIGDYEQLLTAIAKTPDLERYLSEARLRDSEVALALASRSPSVDVGAGIRRLQSTRENAWVFSLAVPLPLLNRNQGLVQEAEAKRHEASARRDAALLKGRTQLYRNYRELEDRRREVIALRERVLPRMESALSATDYAYERGRYSYLELVDAQRELLALRGSLIEAAKEYHLTLIELERLTGLQWSP